MAKHKKDVGLQYIQSLHLNQARSEEALLTEMVRRFDTGRVLDYAQQLDASIGKKTRYNVKFSELDIGRFMAGAQYADLIRRTANWVHAHHEAFGQEILEVGTTAGLLTAFLAQEFPDRHITTIDRSRGSIAAARALLEEQGITNVTLVQSSLHKYAAQHPGAADTAISMAVVQENYDKKLSDPGTQPLQARLNHYYLPAALPYAADLTAVLKEGGTLVSLMDDDPGAPLAGWMGTLESIGFALDYDSYTQIPCTMPQQSVTLCTFLARREADPDLQPLQHPAGSPEAEAVSHRLQRALDFWQKLLCPSIPRDGVVHGSASVLVCEQRKEKLIQGLGFFDEEGVMVGRFALYSLRDDPEHYAILQVYVDYGPDANLLAGQQEADDFRQLMEQIHAGDHPKFEPVLRTRNHRALWLREDPETGLELSAE